MTTYLLGVQQESTSLTVALVKRAQSGKTTLVTTATIPTQSFTSWLKDHIPAQATVQAVLTVPESHIILKELELPLLKGNELAEAVRWELTDKSGVGAESESAWKIVETESDQLRVATMIMKRSEITEAIAFFADANVELTAIEPSAISAARALTIPKDTSVILTFEGPEVSAVFVRSHVPVFSTTFTIPLTDTAMKTKHFSREAAASLVSQLKRIISYWDAKERPVTRIIVTSEASRYSGLKSDVARAFTIPVEAGEVHAAVVGAAMRKEDDINFLPKENRLRIEKRAFTAFARMRLWQFAKINAFVLLLLAAVSIFLLISQAVTARNITQTQRFIDNHPAQKLISHVTSVNALAREISTLTAGQKDTGARLRYLSGVTPPNVQFTSLKMVDAEKEEWLVTGTGDRADILAFYYKLQEDGKVQDVSMPYSNFNRETDSPFSVTIVW